VPYAVIVLGLVGTTVRTLRGRGTVPLSASVFAMGTALVYSLPALVTVPLIRLRLHTEVYWVLLAAPAWLAALDAVRHRGKRDDG